MPIQVDCECGNKFGAPSKYAGKKVKCPKCKSPLVVPGDPKSTGAKDAKKAKKSASAKKIAVKCKCGKSFSAKPELKGKTVRCPGCKEPVKIGAAKKKAAASPPVEMDDAFSEVGLGADGPGRRCPECKAEMSEEAILCIECGYNENLGRKMAVKRPITQEDREQAHQERTLTGGDEKKSKKKKWGFFG